MKIKKKYKHDSGRSIWRILPTETGKLVIEERDKENKQVYFNCLKIESGNKIFKNFQLEEKFWIGIEAVNKDIIYFHKFIKPDMPQHIGIIAMDLNNKKILWENYDYSFLFIWQEKVYCYQQMFEGKSFFALHYKTGESLEKFGTNTEKINKIKKNIDDSNPYANYLFPETSSSNFSGNLNIQEIFQKLKKENNFEGSIDFVQKDNGLFFNFYIANSKGNLSNYFKVLDLSSGNYIFEEILVKETNKVAPDSFFVKDNLLFILFGNSRLSVYSIID